MGSIERVVHIEGRSTSHTATEDVARGQQPHKPTSSFSSPLPTIRIQQATISTSQQFTIATDTIKSNEPTMPVTHTEPTVSSEERHGLSSGAIAGFAMIPIVVILITVGVFAYVWLRKRRRRSPDIRHLGPTPPPPVPEKDFGSPVSSCDSTFSGGRVRNMAAMSTPIVHTGWVASSRPCVRPANDSVVHYNPWEDQLPKISADITTAGLHAPKAAVGSGSDSPIDRSSPFRLKRGDTRKRSSLDPDIMSAWPAPPQPAAQSTPSQRSRTGQTYMERRSISAEYFAQEKDRQGSQEYWEDIGLGLGPDPGPMVRSR
ncbi:hypothetical protein OPT61_g1889 [Boeremia exigua]|uniref:Uncharacterized protein n=1 Tax=Boeremia exigua TaxID=749465 RepID=A0ACC2ING7_9PLEO|nr:hypothetical protein OPT61_g1889 [Boeremia exigua]